MNLADLLFRNPSGFAIFDAEGKFITAPHP